MIDSITNMHRVTDKPNTHKRGSTIIDLVLCTMGISCFIACSGYLLFNYITISDHRGLYIDIQLKLYVQDPMHIINDMSSRLLSTSNHKGVTVYKKNLLEHILKNDTIKRVNIIQQKIDSKSLKDKNLKTIDKIDHDITPGVLQVETRIKQYESSHPWSPVLVYTIL